jgi:hypothetical protein
MVEFGIAHEATKCGDDWYVIGRCVTDIRVGDRFAKFVPHLKVGGPELDTIKFLTLDDAALPIDLTITKIEAYGKVFDQWSAGMTAGITLRGDGENLGVFGSLCG